MNAINFKQTNTHLTTLKSNDHKMNPVSAKDKSTIHIIVSNTLVLKTLTNIRTVLLRDYRECAYPFIFGTFISSKNKRVG